MFGTNENNFESNEKRNIPVTTNILLKYSSNFNKCIFSSHTACFIPGSIICGTNDDIRPSIGGRQRDDNIPENRYLQQYREISVGGCIGYIVGF